MALTLLDHEKEVLVIRKSPYVFFLQTIGFAAIFFGVPTLFSFIQAHVIAVTFSGEAAIVPSLLRSLWYLLVWIVYFIRFTDFFLDIWIVTTERIVDVNQNGLFSRNIAMLPLDKIEDVTVDASGILPTFLGYGTLSIQTAGEKREFILVGAHRPMQAKETIMRMYQTNSEEIREVKVVQ